MAKRYIDAEELLKYKEREVVEAHKINPTIRYVIDTRFIEQMPAADVVERKRGEWIGYPESFAYEHVHDRDAVVCSCCEQSWNIIDNDTESFNFCPNCGAEMGEVHND